jgi:hypothetical protein
LGMTSRPPSQPRPPFAACNRPRSDHQCEDADARSARAPSHAPGLEHACFVAGKRGAVANSWLAPYAAPQRREAARASLEGMFLVKAPRGFAAERETMIGRKFGRLTTIAQRPSSGGKRRLQCLCDCGQETTTFAWKLLAGKTRSCGCLKIEQLNTRQGHELHGMRGSPEYAVWVRLKSLCYNPRTRGYAKVGGAGIKIAPDWEQSFSAFFDAVGPRPSRRHELMRYDETGDFSAENCRWVLIRKARHAEEVRGPLPADLDES